MKRPFFYSYSMSNEIGGRNNDLQKKVHLAKHFSWASFLRSNFPPSQLSANKALLLFFFPLAANSQMSFWETSAH